MPKIGEALVELAVVPALGWPSKLVRGREGVCSIEDNSGATCQDAPVLRSWSCVAGLTIEAMQASRTAPKAAVTKAVFSQGEQRLLPGQKRN